MLNIIISINIGLFLAYISLTMCHCKILKMINSLTPEELSLYQQIRQKRMINYGIGLFISIIIIFLYLLLNKDSFYYKLNFSVLFILAIPIFVYTLIPIKVYFLEKIEDQVVKNEWFQIYKCMKYNFCLYFTIGFIISLILFYFFNLIKKRNCHSFTIRF